jgi:hypothetical protein
MASRCNFPDFSFSIDVGDLVPRIPSFEELEALIGYIPALEFDFDAFCPLD